MTTTKLRLAAAGIAALLGLGLAAAPSAATTVSPSSTAEAGELVPFHAGHDHSADDKAKSGQGKDAKKNSKKKAGDKGKDKGKGQGKRKGKSKCGDGHHKDDGHDHDHACH